MKWEQHLPQRLLEELKWVSEQKVHVVKASKERAQGKTKELPQSRALHTLIELLFQLEKDSLLAYVSDNKRGANYMTFTTIDEFHAAGKEVS